MKKWLNNLSTAVDNLVHVLITPRHVTADELAAREFCQKVRALGEDPAAALGIASMFVAVGTSSDEAMIFARMSAKRMITNEDINVLVFRHGYKAYSVQR